MPKAIADIWNPYFTIDQYLLDIRGFSDIQADTRSFIAIAIRYNVKIIIHSHPEKPPKEELDYSLPTTLDKLNIQTLTINGSSANQDGKIDIYTNTGIHRPPNESPCINLLQIDGHYQFIAPLQPAKKRKASEICSPSKTKNSKKGKRNS